MKINIDRSDVRIKFPILVMGKWKSWYLDTSQYEIYARDRRIERFKEIEFDDIDLLYSSEMRKEKHIALDLYVLSSIMWYFRKDLSRIPWKWGYRVINFSGTMFIPKIDLKLYPMVFLGWNKWYALDLRRRNYAGFALKYQEPLIAEPGPNAVLKI